jgi:hypothetical protein
MKINPVENRHDESLVSQLIIHGMSQSFGSLEMEECYKKLQSDKVLEVQLLVEGKEVDLKHFCDHWQSQVSRMIQDEAHKMIEARLSLYEVEDSIRDLQKRLQKEIDKRLEDWEKEIE